MHRTNIAIFSHRHIPIFFCTAILLALGKALVGCKSSTLKIWSLNIKLIKYFFLFDLHIALALNCCHFPPSVCRFRIDYLNNLYFFTNWICILKLSMKWTNIGQKDAFSNILCSAIRILRPGDGDGARSVKEREKREGKLIKKDNKLNCVYFES